MSKRSSVDSTAEEELRRRIKSNSLDSEDYRQLAGTLISKGNYSEAISLYQRALGLSPTDLRKAELAMELGWLLYETGKQSEALPLAQTALQLLSAKPETSKVLACRGASQSLLAHCIWSTDEKSGMEAARLALEWLERVITEYPSFEEIADVYYDAARLQNILGNTKQAVILCEKCLQHQSKQGERIACLLVMSESLRREERFIEAEKALEEVFRFMETRQETWPRAYLELGLIQRFTNRFAEAKETFRQAIQASEADQLQNTAYIGQLYWNLAAACYELEEYREAAALFEKAILYHGEGDQYYSDALIWLGHCYFVTRDYAEAREWYKKILLSCQSSNEQKAEAQEGLAKTYYQLSDYERAVREFEQLLPYYPEGNSYRPTVLLSLGNSYEGAGAYRRAQDFYEKVLSSADASDADKASARQGVVENLGKLSYELKQYDEAAAAFEEALTYYTDDDFHRPNVLLWLGNSYEGSRIYTRARECYEKLLASPHVSEADRASAEESLARLPEPFRKTFH